MDIHLIKQAIFDSLEIDEKFLAKAATDDEQFVAFRNLLIRRIEELAEKDMEKLYTILYRIDVNEKKLKETLKNTAPENFALVIADMIIARQYEKAESRKKFGGENEDWNFDI